MATSRDQFISQVKKKAEEDIKRRKSVAPSNWRSTLLKGTAWMTAAIGILLAVGFFILMESVYSQLGGVANLDLASTLESTPELRDFTSSIGINWFPEFMKIYSIRFAIVLGVLAVTACIAFALFSFSRNAKDKQ